MSWPEPADLQLLAEAKSSPCVSLYVPFRSSFQASMENSQRYGQAVVRAADRLEASGAPVDLVRSWAERLTALEQDLRGFRRPPRGIGAFLDAEALHAYKLATPPSERVVVADCFSLRELVRQVELLRGDEEPPLARPPDRDRIVLELDRILAAAQRGAVRRLWTREGAMLPGRFDEGSGRIVAAPPGGGDVLDGLTASVLRSGGQVFVVPSEKMPGPMHTAAELC